MKMKNIKLYLIALLCAVSVKAFARNGGDDVGNGSLPQQSVRRPTDQIEILSYKFNVKDSILQVSTALGPDIILNPDLGSLYNWCNVQLENDETSPQCVLSVTDIEGKSFLIPVNIDFQSSLFSADLKYLMRGKVYTLKLVEIKTGSNSHSKEFTFIK
jgi:hypothetical protein